MPTQSRKKRIQKKKDGVEMAMKYRNYRDPLYYDPKANDKIFVPVQYEEDMTEEQKKLVNTFSKSDRGVIDDDEPPELVEDDALEAAAKKAKIKQKAMKQRRKERELEAGEEETKAIGDESEGSWQDCSGEEDSDDIIYDSEEEDLAEEEHKKQIGQNKPEQKDQFYNIDKEIKNVSKYKVMEGVKFVEYDEHGIDKSLAAEVKQWVTKDEGELETVIEAPADVMEAIKRPTGERHDQDKKREEMNEEEKAAFDALENSEEGAYEELEDDFLFLVNEGQVAVVIDESAEQETTKKTKKVEFDLEADYQNKANVHMIDTGEDQEEQDLREYRERMYAMLPEAQAGQNFTNIFAGQNELDKGFEAFMEEEYNDDKIGELDEQQIEAQDLIQKKVIDDAVDEFIEEKKQRFPDHYKEYGQVPEEEVGKIIRAKNVYVPHQDEVEQEPDQEKAKAEIQARMKELALQFEAECEAQGSDIEEDSESEEKWDCDTILTTYTNTDNHPGVITTQRRIKPGQHNKIELHKQFRVPVDGLTPLAEEIIVQKEKKKVNGKNPYQRVQIAEGEAEQKNDEDEGEEPEGKKALKRQVKQENRERRKLKKELKMAFKTQAHKNHKEDVVDIGGIKKGVSVKKIY